MSLFSDFVNLELPQRAVMLTVGNTSYSGNPNLAVNIPKINSAPVGTWFIDSLTGNLWQKLIQNDANSWAPRGGSGGAATASTMLHESQLPNIDSGSATLEPAYALFFTQNPTAGNTLQMVVTDGGGTKVLSFVAGTTYTIEAGSVNTTMSNLAAAINAASGGDLSATYTLQLQSIPGVDGRAVIAITSPNNAMWNSLTTYTVYGAADYSSYAKLVNFTGELDYRKTTSTGITTTPVAPWGTYSTGASVGASYYCINNGVQYTVATHRRLGTAMWLPLGTQVLTLTLGAANGTHTPGLIVPVGAVIDHVVTKVITAYGGTTPTLTVSVGTVEVQTAAENSLKAQETYETDPELTVTENGAQISAVVAGGDEVTGSAKVAIHWSISPDCTA